MEQMYCFLILDEKQTHKSASSKQRFSKPKPLSERVVTFIHDKWHITPLCQCNLTRESRTDSHFCQLSGGKVCVTNHSKNGVELGNNQIVSSLRQCYKNSLICGKVLISLH
jgi:hypothetical protein